MNPERATREEPAESARRAEIPARDLLESAADAILVIDEQAAILLANRQVETLFGFTRRELIGEPIEMLIPERFRIEHVRQRTGYIAQPVIRPMGVGRTLLGRRKDGTEFPVEISLSPIMTADGPVITSVVRDVTEKMRIQDQLLLAHDQLEQSVAHRTAELEVRARQLRSLAELGTHMVRAPDLDAAFSEVVQVVAQVLEVDLCGILELMVDGSSLTLRAGVGWDVAPHDDTTGTLHPAVSPAGADGKPREARNVSVPLPEGYGADSGICFFIDGFEHPFGVLSIHSRDAREYTSDEIQFVQSVAHLLSELVQRTEAENEVHEARRIARQHERLADVGAIVAKVVHDLGNSLAGLSLQTQLIQRRLEQGRPAETLAEPVEILREQTRHLELLVTEFREFSREQRLELCPLAVDEFLASCARSWRTAAREREVEIVLEVAADLPKLNVDAAKLRRVFDNLVLNALEAVDQGPGRVTLTAERHGSLTVRLGVQDTGPGIPDGLDVFRLFETTKDHGTGLGLGVCTQIVQAHGGSIDHFPADGGGTLFRIDLPVDG